MALKIFKGQTFAVFMDQKVSTVIQAHLHMRIYTAGVKNLRHESHLTKFNTYRDQSTR